MNQPTQIILASASPRRRQLLNQMGISHALCPVDIDETPEPGEQAELYVRRMAAVKSEQAWQTNASGLPVLAADTAVVLDGRIMGKPKNEADALRMLTDLSGKTHRVFSAVSLRTGEQQRQALSITEVCFREINVQEMRHYWRTGEPADKAGAYAIQGIGSIFVRRIRGSFSGVMGLPLFETAKLLRQAGFKILSA